MAISSALLLLLLQPANGLLLGSPGAALAPRTPLASHQRAPHFSMLTEDEEYEEFRRKKLGLVKELGSDENFGTYRRFESGIYVIG
ncbi:MAG: hypothetical protein SGPRY_013315, partial [Prymnesium sp.]